MPVRRRRPWLIGGLGALIAAAAITLVLHSGGQRQVRPDLLPLVQTANVTRTHIDCSEDGLAGYIPNRPCDTYFLATSNHFRSAAALLTAETRLLVRRGWRYAPATTWGQSLGANGWIGPRHRGCAVVRIASAGSAAQAHLAASIDMGAGFVTFGKVAGQSAGTPSLWVILQPGYDAINRPRC